MRQPATTGSARCGMLSSSALLQGGCTSRLPARALLWATLLRDQTRHRKQYQEQVRRTYLGDVAESASRRVQVDRGFLIRPPVVR